jgi:UDP-glucose 4-epimerase
MAVPDREGPDLLGEGILREHRRLEYRQINTDLPVAVAKQAKASGVRQFIFMSSLSVYGLRVGIIDKKTIPAPTTMYGKSKLAAEKQLQALSSPDFHILILRPPLIYGEGCKGNYQKLVSFAKKALFFPDFPNSRSMLSIDNLCVLLRAAIVTEAEGVSLLQDPSFICTSEMVRAIAQQNHHKLTIIPCKKF